MLLTVGPQAPVFSSATTVSPLVTYSSLGPRACQLVRSRCAEMRSFGGAVLEGARQRGQEEEEQQIGKALV